MLHRPNPLDRLPTCTFKTLERAVLVTDTIQLEHLAWAVFDNMGPGKTPPLSGLETYSQIVGHLADKAYKGLHTRCPACTSASFGAEVTKVRAEGPDSKKCAKPQHYSMTWDIREEFAGSYSALKEKQSAEGRDQSSTPTHPVNPNIQGMKWMKEYQRSYCEVQLGFWLLLRPLMDRGEESTRQLACRLLSMWHWSSAVDPPTYPPMPTSMNIGYWLWESDEEDKWQLWIEAYVCALQHMVEASMGWRWITEGEIRVPNITRVVEIFLNATGTRVSPNIIWQCWPAQHENTPVQNLEGMRQSIVHKLDKTATQCTSSITWDQFAFPQTDQEYWREEALCYCLGKTLDVRTRMPGFRLMLQDNKGQYPYSSCALIFEGSMLVYDPQRDIARWVTIQGTSATLTMSELCAANDLNNMVLSPSSELEPAKPLFPEIIKGMPGGTKSDTNSLAIDSGDEWDKTGEVRVFLHCSTPMAKIGPTWAEVHAATQEEEVAKSQTWDDIMSTQLPEGAENWDTEEDSQSTVEPQFKDATVDEEDEEQVVIELVTEEELQQPMVGEPLTREPGKDTIDTISQDMMPIHTGEADI